MADQRYDVFVSYRRERGAAEARVIRAELVQHGLRVFLDVTDLGTGYFDDSLLECIANTPNFLLVLSPRCLDRCAEEGDWLRRELAHAIRSRCKIVPVVLPGFKFPKALPEDISDLCRHQAVEYSHTFFEATSSKILEVVQGTAAAAEQDSGGLYSAHPATSKVRGRRKTWATLSGALLLLTAVCAFLFWRTPKVQAHQRIMAVLPFDAVGQNAATSALGAGLMETVASKLVEADNDDMVEIVAPHELRERGVKSADDARREFGTDMVLEGSLQQSGQELRITCNLVDSKTGRQIGARTMTRDVNDIFSLQDDTVKAAWDMLLAAQIHVQRHDAPATRPETQPAAYGAYIRGRGYLEEYEKPENIENAIAEFKQAVDLDPKYAPAYASLGEVFYIGFSPPLNHGENWLNEAFANCQEALRLDSQLSAAHTCMGNVYFATGKYQDAALQLQRAVDLDPSDGDALGYLADAYERLGKSSAAEAAYKKAIALRPNYWGVYNWLGYFYAGQARYSDAAEMFRKVIELTPDNYRGYSNLGGIYVYQGRYSEAIEMLKKSLELRPSSSAYDNLGAAYFWLHRFPEAVETYRSGLRFKDTDYVSWGNLADALYWIPDHREEAKSAYAKAKSLAHSQLTVNPKDATTLAYLAEYNAMLDQKDEAIRGAQLALNLAPADPEVMIRAALVYNHFGDTKATLSSLANAVKSGGSRSNVRDTPDFGLLKTDPEFRKIVE